MPTLRPPLHFSWALKSVYFIDEIKFVHTFSCFIDHKWTCYPMQLESFGEAMKEGEEFSTGSTNLHTMSSRYTGTLALYHLHLTAQAKRTISPREPAVETPKSWKKNQSGSHFKLWESTMWNWRLNKTTSFMDLFHKL